MIRPMRVFALACGLIVCGSAASWRTQHPNAVAALLVIGSAAVLAYLIVMLEGRR